MKKDTYLVGVGSSAGGLDALVGFLQGLELNSSAFYALCPHLAPEQPSMMSEILERKTGIPVQVIQDGTSCEPGKVYITPPGHIPGFSNGMFRLRPSTQSSGLALPIDDFLRGAAEAYEDKSVAVILSGSGSDGSRGVRSVKELGGTVIVQSVESSAFDGMPSNAIASGVADYEGSPKELAQFLNGFLKNALARQDELLGEIAQPENLERMLNAVRRQTKMDFAGYKEGTVCRRTERRMRFHGILSTEDYAAKLESDPDEAQALGAELLIGVTRFFREAESLRRLEQLAFPAIFNKPEKEQVRVWVPACSTGEEAFTMAMLLKEYAASHNHHHDLKVFATDVDKAAIKIASASEYSPSVSADIPKGLLERYFEYSGDLFVAKRGLRDMVVFAHHNILTDPPFTRLDLISCRNLLIYLKPETQKKVASVFAFGLKSNGFLLLGQSESLPTNGDEFQASTDKHRIYQLKSRLPRAQSLMPDFTLRIDPGVAEPGNNVRAQLPNALQADFSAKLSDILIKDGLLVNSDYEPVYVYGNIGRYFTLKPGKSNLNVTKMAHRDLEMTLTSLLSRTFSRGESGVPLLRHVKIGQDTSAEHLTLLVHRLETRDGKTFALLIVYPNLQAGDGQEDASGSKRTIKGLEEEISSLKESLREALDDSETNREELQATNEELIASNEELQSTNEELQSLNEELHTLNSELRSKIDELAQTSRDLENLMEISRIGSLFLDREFRIRKFSPKAAQDLDLLQADIGRSVHHFKFPMHPTLAADVGEVLKTNEPLEKIINNQPSGRLLVRIHPHSENKASEAEGAIVVYVELGSADPKA